MEVALSDECDNHVQLQGFSELWLFSLPIKSKLYIDETWKICFVLDWIGQFQFRIEDYRVSAATEISS